MGGSSAQLADSSATNNSSNNLQGYTGAAANSGVQNALSQFANGGMSLSSALSALQGQGGATGSGGQAASNAQQAIKAMQADPAAFGGAGSPAYNAAMSNQQNALNQANSAGTSAANAGLSAGAVSQLFSNPETAGLAAQSQVMSNPIYSGLFGQNGQLGQAENNYSNATGNLASDRQALSGNDPSYGLQSSDLAAYGQASNALGKQFSAQNQGLAQQLAARGLASGSNGATAQSFAGQYGNQAEQLAGLQQQISQNRINTAQNLAQARNASDLSQQQGAGQLSTQLGNLGNTAYQGQLGSNMAGAENQYNQLAGGNASALNNQIGQQNINNTQFQQQQSSSLGGMLGGAIGGLASSVAGGLGGGLGKSLGSALSGSSTPKAAM